MWMIREMLGTKGMALERTNRGWTFTIDRQSMPLTDDKCYYPTREDLVIAMETVGISARGIEVVTEQPFPAGREKKL